MKFIKLTAVLSCLFFACTNAFAIPDQIIEIHLSGGTTVGSPSVFYMNKTQQKFCVESTCETTLTQLSELPTDANPYVGTVINGVPLIQDNGQIITDDFIFSFTIPDSIYTATNLFSSKKWAELHFTGTNASPSYITMDAAYQSWINPETNEYIFKLSAIPTSPGKKFLAFSTTPALQDDGSLIVIGGDGNILSFAKSLSGNKDLFALWENLPTEIICKAGEYLPEGKTECGICLDNNWCPGGTFNQSTAVQGMNSCPADAPISPKGSDSADDCKTGSETITCSAGYYLPMGSSNCTECFENGWCPGGEFSFNNMTQQGANWCPAEAPISPKGSDSADDCIAGATVFCTPGNYLPKLSNACKLCVSNNFCSGGDFYTNYSVDQGLNACEAGLISGPGSTVHTDCHAPNPSGITCMPGEFLQAGATSCSLCYENNWCPGGDFYTNYSVDQGLNVCKPGLISGPGSTVYTDCHAPNPGDITCYPGNYLPANSSTCSSCMNGNWCPGGTFSASTSDQGTNICPNDGQSVGNTNSIYQCYKDQLPTYISNGTGDETCFYGTIGYTEKCIKYVRSCDGGYYSEKDLKGNNYCSTAGIGYYSPQGDLNRYQCPGTKNIPVDIKRKTPTDTSSSISQCYVTNVIYTTGTSEVINGVGLTSCSYSEAAKGYGIAEIMNYEPLTLPKGPITDPQCTNSKIVFCFGGYFLENDSGLECGPVGDGYYSPRPNFNEITGCLDKSGNCPYEFDVEIYQSSRGREKCPDPYIHSELPRNTMKKCYKDCILHLPNSIKVTPTNSKIYITSGGKGEPQPTCKFNVECKEGYKVLENDSEKPSCILDGSICQNDPNALESDSKCVPTKCKDGYHIENSKCIANVVACDIENGLGRKEWMKDNVLGGKWTMCTAYKCNPGYTSKRYLTDEKDKPCGECRNRRDKNGNIVVSAWKETNCGVATCMYQGELYRLDSTNNTCVQICDTAGREDLTGTMLWDPLSEKCERTCKPGFTEW